MSFEHFRAAVAANPIMVGSEEVRVIGSQRRTNAGELSSDSINKPSINLADEYMPATPTHKPRASRQVRTDSAASTATGTLNLQFKFGGSTENSDDDDEEVSDGPL